MSGWNTIDSDAGVFTELVERLGVKNVELNDLYAIDAESLESVGPVYGVVFLFKYGQVDRTHAENGNQPLVGEYDRELDLFFANQTIQNACATQAVLNILLNKAEIDVGEELANFRLFVGGFDSDLIGETISNSDLIRSVHNSFSAPAGLAVDDDKRAPSKSDDDGVFHFVGYIQANGHIYELDGLKSYPIKHVACESQHDFYTKLPEVIQQRIAKYDASELRFSLIALTNNKLEQARLDNDIHEIDVQLTKREAWYRENQLCKHDYTGLIVELVKNIAKGLSESEWNGILENARAKTRERLSY